MSSVAASIHTEIPRSDLRGPSLGHELATQFLWSLQAQDYNGALEAYSSAPTWEDRAFCIEYAAGSDIDVSLLDPWCEAWPNHVLPALLRGAVLVARGDEIAALPDLRDASRADDKNPIPWAQLLRCAMQQRAPVVDLEAMLAEMLERYALYEGHIHYIRGLSATGSGSTEQMLTFARVVNKILPAGSAIRAAVAVAVIEALLAEAPDDHIAYLSEKGLTEELLQAAGQSVFHPQFDKAGRIPRIKAMNAFVIALSMSGHEDLALMLADRLDGAVTQWPLSYLGRPTEAAWATLHGQLQERSEQAAITQGRAGQMAG